MERGREGKEGVDLWENQSREGGGDWIWHLGPILTLTPVGPHLGHSDFHQQFQCHNSE